MRDQYSRITRRFKIRGFLGPPLSTPQPPDERGGPHQWRGAAQGCAFWMYAMNCAALAWLL